MDFQCWSSFRDLIFLVLQELSLTPISSDLMFFLAYTPQNWSESLVRGGYGHTTDLKNTSIGYFIYKFNSILMRASSILHDIMLFMVGLVIFRPSSCTSHALVSCHMYTAHFADIIVSYTWFYTAEMNNLMTLPLICETLWCYQSCSFHQNHEFLLLGFWVGWPDIPIISALSQY